MFVLRTQRNSSYYMQCDFVSEFSILKIKVWEIYTFLAVGKGGKGKALLQSLVLVLVERTANVLFPLRLTLQFVLLSTSEECKITSQK